MEHDSISEADLAWILTLRKVKDTELNYATWFMTLKQNFGVEYDFVFAIFQFIFFMKSYIFTLLF